MLPSPLSGCGLGLRGFAFSGPPVRSLALRPGDSLTIPDRWLCRWASEPWFPSSLPSKLRGVWLLPRRVCLPLNAPAFAGRTTVHAVLPHTASRHRSPSGMRSCRRPRPTETIDAESLQPRPIVTLPVATGPSVLGTVEDRQPLVNVIVDDGELARRCPVAKVGSPASEDQVESHDHRVNRCAHLVTVSCFPDPGSDCVHRFYWRRCKLRLMLRTGQLPASFHGRASCASTPRFRSTPAVLLPGTLASPQAGLSRAGCCGLVARLPSGPSSQ
jgi:hypothetical protein